MAWFQNLAGRAEDLLNTIDKNAATVLNESTSIPLSEHDSDSTPSVLYIDETSHEIVNHTKLTSISSDFSSHEVEIDVNSNSDDHLTAAIKIPEYSQINNEDLAEGSNKSDKQSSRSSSLHNSFILADEVQNYDEKITKLELENQDLNKQVLHMHHLYSDLRNENSNLQSQIEVSNYLVKTAQSEMEQYKARAQRILQEKEELRELQHQSVKSSDDSNSILSKHTEELKQELDFQENKNTELTEKVKKLTQDLTVLQQQLMHIQNSSQETLKTLQDSLGEEKKIRVTTEEECRIKTQELQIKIQELMQQYEILKDKNQEIDSLKEAFKQTTNISSNEGFENRIKSLTNTLMVKQNALETVTTERNAMRLQLEKIENEYHKNLTQLERAQVRVINVNDTDDVKSQVPQFMRLSPFDAGVTRRVKHAYSTVDAISIRTGIFLRRYPLARVLVFCYMVLLHFWVLIILFIYAPNSR